MPLLRVRDRLLPLANLLVPNQFEAHLLTGLPINNEQQALAAAAALHAKGPHTVVRGASKPVPQQRRQQHRALSRLSAADTAAPAQCLLAPRALSRLSPACMQSTAARLTTPPLQRRQPLNSRRSSRRRGRPLPARKST